jgi:hypothetical protein
LEVESLEVKAESKHDDDVNNGTNGVIESRSRDILIVGANVCIGNER